MSTVWRTVSLPPFFISKISFQFVDDFGHGPDIILNFAGVQKIAMIRIWVSLIHSLKNLITSCHAIRLTGFESVVYT